MNDFVPHSEKQDQAIFSDSKITLLGTGIQFGKTMSGALWMKRLMCQFTAVTDNFIIAAPTYKILEQSTLPAFLSVMDGLGEYNKTKAYFKMHSGGTCYMRTGTEPDSVVGITNVRGVWGDEAGKYTLYFWENLQGRASFKDCPIILTTSPYTINWIYKDLIKPKQKGGRADVKLIQAMSIENPYFPREEYERRKLVMDPRRFQAMYGGMWEKMAGLVYDCFDEDENICEAVRLDPNWRYVAGVDWGYSPDPFVIGVRAITPSGMHYKVSEFCKTGQTPSDMVSIAKSKKNIFGITQFYCDPSQPGLIEEFNRNGVPAVPADNDITRGIGLHYELIKSRQFKIFRDTSPYTVDEIETYHYPEPQDLKPDQDAKEPKPVDQNNHNLDADRYATIMTYRSNQKIKPHAPAEAVDRSQENNMARIKRLMRPSKGRGKHTESWGGE